MSCRRAWDTLRSMDASMHGSPEAESARGLMAVEHERTHPSCRSC